MQNIGEISFTPLRKINRPLNQFSRNSNCGWHIGTNLHGIIALKRALKDSQQSNLSIKSRNTPSVSRFQNKNQVGIMNNLFVCVCVCACVRMRAYVRVYVILTSVAVTGPHIAH
jgi:hypothetical protein